MSLKIEFANGVIFFSLEKSRCFKKLNNVT